jgi:hypothetical protein
VLKKMAHAGHVAALVASAGLDEEAQGRGIGVAVALGDDLQAVFQDRSVKFQRKPPASEVRGSSDTLPGTSPQLVSRIAIFQVGTSGGRTVPARVATGGMEIVSAAHSALGRA